WRMVSRAIWVASGCEVAAMASGANTSERVAKGWPVMRSAHMAGAPARAVARAARKASSGAVRKGEGRMGVAPGIPVEEDSANDPDPGPGRLRPDPSFCLVLTPTSGG